MLNADKQQAKEQDNKRDNAEYSILNAQIETISKTSQSWGQRLRLQKGTPKHNRLADKMVHEIRKGSEEGPKLQERDHPCEGLRLWIYS